MADRGTKTCEGNFFLEITTIMSVKNTAINN
jgi:hypothetical protein